MKKLKFVSGRTNDEHTHSLSNTQVNEEMTYNRVMLTHILLLMSRTSILQIVKSSQNGGVNSYDTENVEASLSFVHEFQFGILEF